MQADSCVLLADHIIRRPRDVIRMLNELLNEPELLYAKGEDSKSQPVQMPPFVNTKRKQPEP